MYVIYAENNSDNQIRLVTDQWLDHFYPLNIIYMKVMRHDLS